MPVMPAEHAEEDGARLSKCARRREYQRMRRKLGRAAALASSSEAGEDYGCLPVCEAGPRGKLFFHHEVMICAVQDVQMLPETVVVPIATIDLQLPQARSIAPFKMEDSAVCYVDRANMQHENVWMEPVPVANTFIHFRTPRPSVRSRSAGA